MTVENLQAIEVDQFFSHPPAKVWRALTTPALMGQWLMPNDFEPTIGHHFTFQTRPVAQTGFSGTIACEVLDLVPQQRLRISWTDAEHPDQLATEVTWTLVAEGSGTRVFIEHTGFDPDDANQQLARRFMDGGWRSHVLRRLGDLLGTLD